MSQIIPAYTFPEYPIRPDPSKAINQGLVGWWPFFERGGTVLRDISGRNNNGTINGATWTAGERGPALHAVVNSSDYASHGFSFSGNLCSTLLWIRVDAFGSNGLLPWGDDPLTSYHWFRTTTSIRVLATNVSVPSYTLNDARWHLWAFIGKGTGGLEVYRDGALLGSSGTAGVNVSAGASIRVGNAHLTGYDATGEFGPYSFYNRALTASEISQLYRDPWAGLWRPKIIVPFAGTGAAPQTPDAVVVNVICPAPTIGVAPASVAVNVTCPNTTVGVATDSATVTATCPAPSIGATVQTVQMGVTVSAPAVGATCDTATISVSCQAPSIAGARIPDVSIVSVVVPNPTVGIAVTSIPILVYAPSPSSGGTLSVEGPLVVQYGAPSGNRISHSGPSGNVIVKSPAKGGYAKYDENP